MNALDTPFAATFAERLGGTVLPIPRVKESSPETVRTMSSDLDHTMEECVRILLPRVIPPDEIRDAFIENCRAVEWNDGSLDEDPEFMRGMVQVGGLYYYSVYIFYENTHMNARPVLCLTILSTIS